MDLDLKQNLNNNSLPKIISIMPVWNEQRMIALSIASTKDIVYQYIVLIKKSTDDKTKGILERKNMIAFQMKNYENIKAWKC
jgi:glycosyltransferase involved in cell wall biosynthesis